MWIGTYTVTLVTAGDSANFSTDDLVYFYNGTIPGAFGTTYEVLSTDTGTVTFQNLPTTSITGFNMFENEWTIQLATVGDAANFSVGQTVFFSTDNPPGEPTTTYTVEAIDTDTGVLTMSSYPGDLSVGEYIFRGSALYSAIRVITSSLVPFVRGVGING